MKLAIVALDGGGSNLRILIADKETKEILHENKVDYGTNLSTVPDKKIALENLEKLIVDGCARIPSDYYITGMGLSSAGTEIVEDKKMLEQTLRKVADSLESGQSEDSIRCFVTNDIDILLANADIALVAGTGTVGAVKYNDVTPYDNVEESDNYKIYKFDGNGPYIGDKGSGYWIGKEVLTRVSEIENLGRYVNRKNEIVKVEPQESILRGLVLRLIAKENNMDEEDASKWINSYLNSENNPQYVTEVYSATEDNFKPFDRAKVGKLFSKVADLAAEFGDETANDILEQAAMELYKNIEAAYEKGGFNEEEESTILLSGSVLVHSEIVQMLLKTKIYNEYPFANVVVNNKKPVWSTFEYVKNELEGRPLISNASSIEEKEER